LEKELNSKRIMIISIGKYKIDTQSELYKSTQSGFSVGLIIPVLAWLLAMIFYKLQISFHGFLEIHRINVSIWIIDCMPLILASKNYYSTKHLLKAKRSLEKEIEQRDNLIRHNIKIANEILLPILIKNLN
jgi:hypothetical protein